MLSLSVRILRPPAREAPASSACAPGDSAWKRILCAALLACTGFSTASAATIEATPSTAPPGAMFLANIDGITSGSTYRIYLERGDPFVQRFLLSEFVAADSESSRKLAVPESAQQSAHHLVLYGVAGGFSGEVGRTPFTVGAALSVSLQPTSAEPGRAVQVTVTGTRAGSIAISYAGRVLLGPVAVGEGSYTGRFIVPRDVPATIPGTTTVIASNTVGRFVVARGSRSFSVLAPSGLPAFRSTFTAPPPSTAVQGTRLDFAGRLQQPDGSGTNGRTSFFWKGDDGTVVPIDGGVSTAADGSYAVKARAPSLFMDGVRANGNGRILSTMRDDDPHTGKRRDHVADTGNGLVNQDPTSFDPGEGQLLIRLRGLNVLGQPTGIADAYVEVLGGVDDAFSDPHDGIPPASDEDLLAVQNQLSPLQSGFGGRINLPDASGCPITFSRQRTNVDGDVIFEFDRELLQSLLIQQATKDMGEIRTIDVGANVPGVEIFEQVGAPGRKGAVSGDVIYVALRIFAGHRGFGETNLLDSDGNPVSPVPDEVAYQPTYVTLGIDLGSGDITAQSGTFGTIVTPAEVALADRVLTIQPPRLNPFASTIAPENLRIAGLTKPTGNALKTFVGMHSFPSITKWPDAHIVPRNENREMRFAWEVGFGPANNAKLLLNLPARPGPDGTLIAADGGYREYGTFAIAGDTACNLDGVNDYAVGLPDLTRLPIPTDAQGTTCVLGRIEVDRSGAFVTARQQFRICTRRPPPDMNVQNEQIDKSTFVIDALSTKYDGAILMPMSAVDDGGNSRMREYHVPPQDNASNNDGSFHLGLNAVGGAIEEYNTIAQPLIGSEGTLPTVNELASFGFNESGLGVDNVDRKVILDTGTIPLFRYPWGFSPIAGAVLGADFWLGASVGFYGTAGNPSGEGSMLDATIDPRMEGGVDMFFDLDVLFGLISASVSALPSLDLTLREVIGNGGLFPLVDPPEQSGICYGFDLDVEMEICAVVCASDEFNLFRVQEGTGCINAPVRNKTTLAAGRGGFDLAKPRLLANALAADGYGRELVLQVDLQNRLVASHMEGLDLVAERVLVPATTGIQHVDVEYISGGRALAVWSESSLSVRQIEAVIGTPPAEGRPDNRARNVTDDLARAQVLRYSFFDGSAWSAPQVVGVAQPGSVGKPRLARCRFSFNPLDGCASRSGAAFLVWEHDANQDIARPDMEIWGAGFTPGGGFSAAVRLSSAAGSSDMQADVTYMGGTPVVAWISNSGTPYGDPADRQIAYRVIDRIGSAPTFPVRTLGRGSSGAGWPSLSALDRDELVLAFTRAQDNSIVGNRNALTVAKGVCVDGLCAFDITQPRDPHGRQIRGERPVVAIDNGEAVFSFRGLAFGPDANGESSRPSDPRGMLLGTGEHIGMRVSNFSAATVEVAVQRLSANGLVHWRPDFVFDSALDAFVGISQEVAQPQQKYRALEFAKRYAGREFAPVSQSKAVGSAGVMLKTLAPTPDFRIEALSLPASYLTASTQVSYTLMLRNAGAAYDPAVHGTALLLASWDAPPGAGIAATTPLALTGPMAANAELTLIRPVGVPAGHNRDEHRTLFIEIRPADAMQDANAEDNQADVTVGDMPIPQDLVAAIKTDSPIIGLDWTAATDPRVVGYRIYKRAENGRFVPYGSSQVAGYADLFAGFRNVENYRVTSYSDRGIESEMSEILVAAPEQNGGVFVDGFEAMP